MTDAQLRAAFLTQRQSLPLSVKIEMTLRRIRHWYEMHDGKVYVSFSGGADSTVLLWLVRLLYPEVPAVFVDTGLEFPEIREFVRTVDNVVWLKPKKTFKQVCEEYGYPVVSKETAQKIHELKNISTEHNFNLRFAGIPGRERQRLPTKWRYLLDAPFKISHKCCHYLKKAPMHRYEKETGNFSFVGTMAAEGGIRRQDIVQNGCFRGGNRPSCRPLSFWTQDDSHSVMRLIPHSVIYDPPYNFDRTGCMFCMFGVHLNCPNKFQVMKRTHPRLHAKGLPAFGIDKVLDYMGVPYQ